MIIVEKSGALTTIQDAGRFGFERFGVSPSGPMDNRSFTLANLLVGNPRQAAALEMTIIGPALRFTEPAVIAFTGANMAPTLDGKPLPLYTAAAVPAGSVLRTGFAPDGCRSYLAVAGGFDVPEVMGSRATSIQNKIGGLKGRKLQNGDELKTRTPSLPLEKLAGKTLPQEHFWKERPAVLRVLLGPQEDEFTQGGVATFLNSVYQVGSDSNRMGYRLQGPVIEHRGDGNIISDGIVTGSVQVPTAGLPIVMLAERQTVGGYPKIATVISVDLPKIGQCRPGDQVRFQKVELEEAQKLYQAYQNELNQLEKQLQQPASRPATCPGVPVHAYSIRVGETLYQVTVQERK
jgi:antagonist of KipI